MATCATLYLFMVLESMRYYKIWKYKDIDQYFLRHLDEKDVGKFILAHFYLLIGCSLPIWLFFNSSRSVRLTGAIVLGIGDSIVFLFLI